jgi:hypothetical protein
VAEIKHVVLLKFKAGTMDSQIAGFFRELNGLTQKIPGLDDFIGGPYSSPEGLNQGFTHGFVMSFRDAAARDVYLPHPEHERVKNDIVPHVDQIVAFDFEVGVRP